MWNNMKMLKVATPYTVRNIPSILWSKYNTQPVKTCYESTYSIMWRDGRNESSTVDENNMKMKQLKSLILVQKSVLYLLYTQIVLF